MLNWLRNVFNRETKTRSGDVGVRVWPRSDSGIPVTHESALKFSAVWACVRVISEAISQMEWSEFGQSENGKRRINGPLDTLLNRRPNSEMTAFTFRETLLSHALTWGNGYAEIERNIQGTPVALWPLCPAEMRVMRDGDGSIYYEYGKSATLLPSQVFHLRGLGYDGLTGYSVVSMAAQSIGLGLVQERAGAAFWKNGARPGGILTPDGTMSREARQQLEAEWNANYGGGQNQNKTVALSHAVKYTAISIPNEDAQFLDSRKFSVDDIARWYRVPPHKVGSLDRATFSNIEHQGIEFVTDTLVPWAMRLEQEADTKLLATHARASRRFTKLSVNSLMRGDSVARAEFYTKMRDLGALSVNDILEAEDRNTIGDDGDVRLVPLNMIPLDKIGIDEPLSLSSSDTDESPDDESTVGPSAALQRAISAAVGRIVTREQNLLKSYGKNTFRSKVEKFYASHPVYIQTELGPLLAIGGCNVPLEWVAEYCEQQRQCVAQCGAAADASTLWKTWDGESWVTRQAAAVIRAAQNEKVAA